MAPTPGLLYVTMQPHSSLSISRFNDWYNNEHGPTRLRLPFITNGFRYYATDLSNEGGTYDHPEWLAWYDITDMTELTKETYTRLRLPEVKSQRETDVMAQIIIKRKLFDFVREWKSPEFKDLEDPTVPAGTGNVLISVTLTLKSGDENIKELNKWYDQEHVSLLQKVPGWLRTRRFVTSAITPDSERGDTEYMALHEYSPTNGLGGPEFRTAISTPWAQKTASEIEKMRTRRVYNLYYTFGPAPRYLPPPDATPWTSPDSKTYTQPSKPSPDEDSVTDKNSALGSTVIAKDGVELSYRLEAFHSTPQDAPLIILSNSILTTPSIWAFFVRHFFSASPLASSYRVLRYETRGRFSLPSTATSPITLDVLSDDIIAILDALRVPKAACLIGVSLGGATVLNTALKYPHRVENIVACDTNAVAPAANKKVWPERVELAESEAAKDPESGEAVVERKLAEATVRRWYALKDGEEARSEEEKGVMEKVIYIVAGNSLDGFKKSVNALMEYDMRDLMKGAEVPALFVVGSLDGVLPDTMKGMAEEYAGGGGKARLEVVEGAGHLPMLQRPKEFLEAVEGFLSS